MTHPHMTHPPPWPISLFRYGTAAYKTTELDDFLSGKANHHRETQGNETRAFRALFKKITIMEVRSVAR